VSSKDFHPLGIDIHTSIVEVKPIGPIDPCLSQ